MPEYEVGEIYEDRKGERYIRVEDLSPDPKPWLFIDWPGSALEPRDEDFPHKPLVQLRPPRVDW
jgi:hypothetical protein